MKWLFKVVAWASAWQFPLFLGIGVCVGFFLVARRYGYPAKPLDGYFPGYGPDEVAAFLKATTDESKSVYRLISGTLDMIFPVVYGLFLAGVIGRTWGIERWWLWGLALIGAAFDVGENSCVIAILGFAAETVPAWLCRCSSTLTVSKWACLGLALLLMLAGWVKCGIACFSGGGTPE